MITATKASTPTYATMFSTKAMRLALIKLYKATQYSLQGLKSVWQKENSFRQECVLLCLAVGISWRLEINWTQRLLLVSAILLVLIVEIINSAIETLVDRISEQPHPLSAQAKDMGSAAVFLTLLLAAVIWVTILCTQ